MDKGNFDKARLVRAALLTGLNLSALIWSTSGFAQNSISDIGSTTGAVQSSAEGDDQIHEAIVVTGSRIARQGYDAPTPTTVVGQELIQAKAPATIIDAIATLPAFKNVSTPDQNGGGANSGSGGQSFVNARGLGPTRTLVLLDGQRFVPSTATGSVDVAVMPVGLLERVDVVTGGASAAYGSDAVAGVVNFVLNNKFTGLKGEAQAGITQRGDNATYRGSLTWGTSFAERGHIVISAEAVTAAGVPGRSRFFTTAPQASVFTNPAYTPTNGQVQRQVLPYVYFNRATFGGVVTSGPLQGLEFLPGKQTGTAPTGTASGISLALAGPANLPFQGYNVSLYTPLDRVNIYGRVSWDIADRLSIYATGVYADSSSGPQGVSASNTLTQTTFTVQRDNAFLPDSVRTRMTNLGLTTLSVGRYNFDWGDILSTRGNITSRGVLGIKGEVAPGWNIDVYGQYGANKNTFTLDNNFIWSRVLQAADAVFRPGTTEIVCRSTLTNPTNGCVPLNIFGAGSASPAAIAAVTGQGRAVLNTTQAVLSASISGEPFSTWAGPVSIAVGAEYRRETANQTVDALSQASTFVIGNPKALYGNLNVKEAFVETVVPLAKDLPFAKSLDINGAARFTDYSTSGRVNTWKLGASWEPVAGVRFRATRSRDIRAPNLLELFTGPFEQGASVLDPVTNSTAFITSRALGNPKLTPEIANTWAVGIVLEPKLLPGVHFSADYYDIKIDSAISTLTNQDIVDRCFAGNLDLCGLVTRNSSNVITAVTRPYLNTQYQTARGIDFDALYTTGLGDGKLTLRALASRIISYKVSDGVVVVENAGSIGTGQPKWQGTLSVMYNLSGFQIAADANYFGPGKVNNIYTTATAIDNNEVPSRTFVNGQISKEIEMGSSKAQFYFNVSNIFDTAPPLLYALSGGANYDRIGRSYRVGVRFSL